MLDLHADFGGGCMWVWCLNVDAVWFADLRVL